MRLTARHAWLLAACAIVLGGCSAYDASLLRGRRGDPVAVDGGQETTAGERAASDAGATAGRAGQASRAAGRGGSAGESGAQAPEGDVQADADSGTITDAGRSDASAADGGGPTCVADPGSDYCRALPALPQVAVIDGQLECGLNLLTIVPRGWNGVAPTPDKRASYAAAWRSDGLYVYVEVHGSRLQPHAADQAIFCGDAVELFVDADADIDDGGGYGATGTMQFLIAAPAMDGAAIEATRFVEGVSQGPWLSKAVRVTRLGDGGYSVEAFIGAADIGLQQWAPNMRVGFSVGVDVAAQQGVPVVSCPGRAGVYFVRVGDPLSECGGEPWCDVGAFCRAMLTP